MADNDKADEELSALYKGLPREEPPPAIDAAVLAAANAGVSKRHPVWKVPLSLAAVLVLSVAVTLRTNDERPEIRVIEPPPPVVAQVSKEPKVQQAPAVKPESRADVQVESPVPQPKAQARPQAAPPREMAKAPRQSEIARSESPAPAKEESAIASASAPAPPPQADAAAQSAAGSAAADARAERAAPRAARSRADAPSLASAAPLAPEAWLDRIIELRGSARHKEADESYAEFRRRYPEYAIAAEKMQKVAPPR